MLSVSTRELRDALRTLGKFTPRHSGIPALQCVLVKATGEGLALAATDLEMGATICVPATAGTGAGRILLNLVQFAAIVGALRKDEFSLEIAGESVFIERTRLRTAGNPDEFPDIPPLPEHPAGIYQPGADFEAAVRYCSPVVSTDITRYALRGVYLDFPRGALVGSDGHRLHYARMGEPAGVPPVIAPPRVLNAVAAHSIVVPRPDPAEKGEPPNEHASRVFFTFPGGVAFARTVEGLFPEYADIVPKTCASCFTARRAELLEGLHQVLPLVSKRRPCCTVAVNGTLDLLVANEEDGAEAAAQVDGALEGSDSTTKVNPHLLWDCLEGLPGATVRVLLSARGGPMVIEDPDSGWFGLIMPLKTDGENAHEDASRPGAGGDVPPESPEAVPDETDPERL